MIKVKIKNKKNIYIVKCENQNTCKKACRVGKDTDLKCIVLKRNKRD